MARISAVLGRILQNERCRGGSSTEAASGGVIEPTEAENLVHELACRWGGRTDVDVGLEWSRHRQELEEEATNASRHGVWLPLLHARRAFGLEPLEWDALWLALGVELDTRMGRLVAYLNDHFAHTRPTLGLLQLVAELHGEVLSVPALLQRALFSDGLLEHDDWAPGAPPLPGLPFWVSRALLPRLLGVDNSEPQDVKVHRCNAALFDQLVLSESSVRLAKEWTANARDKSRRPSSVVVAGPPGSGRTTLACGLAGTAGAALVEVPWDSQCPEHSLRVARREARWYEAGILLKMPDDRTFLPDWKLLLRTFEFCGGPVAFEGVSGESGACLTGVPREVTRFELTQPDFETAARLWEIASHGAPKLPRLDRERLAARFHLTVKQICEVTERCSGFPSERLLAALEEDCRRTLGSPLVGLAHRLPLPFVLDDLVVPDSVRAEFQLALAWHRHQRLVIHEWGFGRRLSSPSGLTLLLHGPPGTGKTMASQVMARELGVDLYRVDLSQVFSKYIGETEKNLGRIFDAAFEAGAMLLFDEADALFGKRTQVHDAHDRYANVEVGYLLQRMEDFNGIAILATNRLRDLDDAFTRRLQFIIEFPLPDETQRQEIWRKLFPTEAAVEANLPLASLARHFEIAGGDIRNIGLAAAFMAASDNRAIGMSHLKRAFVRELTKKGRVIDERMTRLLDKLEDE